MTDKELDDLYTIYELQDEFYTDDDLADKECYPIEEGEDDE